MMIMLRTPVKVGDVDHHLLQGEKILGNLPSELPRCALVSGKSAVPVPESDAIF